MQRNKTIKEAIVRKYPAIGVNDTVEDAVRTMAEHNTSALVVMLDGELIGLVTVTDIIHCLAHGHDWQVSTIGSCMTKCEIIAAEGTRNPCAQLDEDMDIVSAIKVMHEAGVNHLLVTGGSRGPVGVVTSLELIKLLAA